MLIMLCIKQPVHPVPIIPTFNKFSFPNAVYEYSVCCCSRHPTQLPYIGIHDMVVGLEILLNLVPTEGSLIHLAIAHFIAHTDGFYERCFDG